MHGSYMGILGLRPIDRRITPRDQKKPCKRHYQKGCQNSPSRNVITPTNCSKHEPRTTSRGDAYTAGTLVTRQLSARRIPTQPNASKYQSRKDCASIVPQEFNAHRNVQVKRPVNNATNTTTLPYAIKHQENSEKTVMTASRSGESVFPVKP